MIYKNLIALVLISGFAFGQVSVDLSFGVYTSDKATTMYRMFLPVIDALTGDLEQALGKSVDIKVNIYKTYDQAIDALVAGEVDFVRFGPAPYVIAKERSPDITLLALESKKGKKRFKGMIVVRSDSKIKTIEDLKGKRFAFGSEKSTIGRYLAQATLLESGIESKALLKFEYLGRHDKVFRAVDVGDFDAGALKSGTFKSLNKEGRLRSLVTFQNVTKPWIARAGLDVSVAEALSAALLKLRDKVALKGLRIDGFLEAEDTEFLPIRNAMKASEAFDPAGNSVNQDRRK